MLESSSWRACTSALRNSSRRFEQEQARLHQVLDAAAIEQAEDGAAVGENFLQPDGGGMQVRGEARKAAISGTLTPARMRLKRRSRPTKMMAVATSRTLSLR